MKNLSKTLSTQESLQIITDMIRQAKGNFRNNSFYFQLWGGVVFLANLSIYALLTFTSYSNPYQVWLITLPAVAVTFWYGWRQGKKAQVVSHLEKVNAGMWVCYGLVVFTLILFGEKINWQLNPLILLLTAIPTLATGILLRFRPLIFGGIIFWISGILCFLVSFEAQHLLAALAIALGYLVPGFILNKKEQ